MMKISDIFRCGVDLSWMDGDFDFYVQQKKQYLKNKNDINYIHYITAYEGLLSDCKVALSCGDINYAQFDDLLTAISDVAVKDKDVENGYKISDLYGPPSNTAPTSNVYIDRNGEEIHAGDFVIIDGETRAVVQMWHGGLGVCESTHPWIESAELRHSKYDRCIQPLSGFSSDEIEKINY